MKRSQSRIINIFLFLSICILLSGNVFAADVAYIYNKNFKIDSNIKELFNTLNLSVDMIQESKVSSTNFSKYRFLFLGDERYLSPRTIPVGKYPTVITNYYHGYEWGLTDSDQISKLVRTEPMSVKINNTVVQVYTDGVYDYNVVGIPYYYLGKNNKAADMIQIAGTYSGNGYDLGDVISYAGKGSHLVNGKIASGNICFYGIVSSKYWTPEAKNMFLNCLNFAGSVCSKTSDCPANSNSSLYCINSSVYKNSTDYTCSSPNTIYSKCNANTIVNKIEDCAWGCSNGNCLPRCINNSQCDDNNTNTEDTCLSPGLKNSSCVNKQITCFNNSGCGTNGLTGDLICQNNDVFQNYITFTCNNPGLGISSCSNSSELRLKTDCSDKQVCSNGQCMNVTCFNDNECNDNRDNTEDKCLNPGLPTSYCVHNPITCNTNSQCGTDGLNGPLFCSDNKVYQNSSIFTCNNPRTTNSSCSDVKTPQLIRTCSNDQVCSNGECKNVLCFNSNDCGTNQYLNQLFCKNDDLYDKYLTFTCNNPGLPIASCSNSTSDRIAQDCSDKCYNNECVNITCYNNAQCNDFNINTEDTCNYPGTANSYCSHNVIHCNKHSDCGVNGFGGNKYCKNGNSFDDFVIYTCNYPGTSQSSCSNSRTPVLSEYCEFECASGECVGCFNDLSCGENKFVGDKFCKNNDVYQDYEEFDCSNPGTGRSKCSSSTSEKLVKDCEEGCFKGKCIDVTCTTNMDCDDSNPKTKDECNNAGTANSYCTNTEMNCNSNADCGINGFLGSEFCIANNVFGDYQRSTCINAGTTDSYCAVSRVSTLLSNCGDDYCEAYGQAYCKNGNVYHSRTCYDKQCTIGRCSSETSQQESPIELCRNGCWNGQCINVKCSTNADCNDNNPNTDDKCMNPGTASSYCSHDFITCSQDIQCGQNGLVGDKFCSNNSVFQNFRTFVCNSPGTVNSYCSSSTQPVLNQNCNANQICGNGNCNQNTCLDQDLDGYDTCNAGTPGDDGKPVDCNDNNANIHPNANEICNGIDDDCDGLIDENNGNCAIGQTCTNGQCVNNCVVEGGTIPVMLNAPQCCAGLTLIPPKQQLIIGIAGICTAKCGNGVCDLATESEYNCPQDCRKTQCADLVDNDHDSLIDSADPGCWNDIGNPLTYNSSLDNESRAGIRCFVNADCNDNNARTIDVCVNPGTGLSNCINTEVVCTQNTDCGIDHWTGDSSCDHGKVYQNYMTYTCNNPNTASSSCSMTSTPRLKQDCGSFSCSQGQCTDVEVCVNQMTGSIIKYGLNFTPISNHVEADTTNTLTVKINNLESNTKTITLQKYSCRCSEAFGDPYFKCYEYWPSLNYIGPFDDFWNKNSCQLVNETITIGPNQESSVNVVVTQSQNRHCGFFQNDLALVKINGTNVLEPLSTGIIGLCNECSDCRNNDFDGYDTCNIGTPGDDGRPVDCNDANPNIRPNANEICNGIDDDCDGLIDENNGNCGNGQTCTNGHCVYSCLDNDHDGYDTCSSGTVGDDGKPVDCNDNDANIHPDANEVCDGKDNDCDGLIDENNGNCGNGQTCTNGQCVGLSCVQRLVADTTTSIAGNVSTGGSYSIIQSKLQSSGFTNNANTGQSGIQTWTVPSTQTLEVTYRYDNAGATNIFGYYVNGDINTFKPLFVGWCNNPVPWPNVPWVNTCSYKHGTGAERSFNMTANAGDKISFAIYSMNDPFDPNRYLYSQDNKNDDGKKHFLTYNNGNGGYFLAIKDTGDMTTFANLLVTVKPVGC